MIPEKSDAEPSSQTEMKMLIICLTKAITRAEL